MATFGCHDIDVDCAFTTEINEAEPERTVADVIAHAQTAHPEFRDQMNVVEDKVRQTIQDLLRQSKYHEQNG